MPTLATWDDRIGEEWGAWHGARSRGRGLGSANGGPAVAEMFRKRWRHEHGEFRTGALPAMP